MIKRLLTYVISFLLCQLLFLFFYAQTWSFVLLSCLFMGLILVDFIHVSRKKTFEDPFDTVPHYDPTMDLDTAKRVQEALLSIHFAESDKINITRRCIPASTLGGDFYTFINKRLNQIGHRTKSSGIVEFVDQPDDIIGLTIGDVAGHGVSSALVMALASGILSRIGLNNQSPAVILQRANTDIQKFISNSHISHVTAFYATVNLTDMSLTFSNAGHPPAILLHEDLSYDLLEAKGVFLGMFSNETYQEKKVSLKSGDRLLLFTDGIVETINLDREPFGIDRLIDLSIIHASKPSSELVEIVFEQLYAFREGAVQRDDQTLVVVDIK